ncbi:MAG: hypothetical protein M3Q24_01725 [bacterium]|nr:hypothetical protein [bacterium]
MNSWSQRRKRIILSIISFVVVIFIGLPLFFFVYKSPTCSDQKKNADETGIDCGGGCEMLCQADNLPIILQGDPQVIKVASTTYAIVVKAENPNINAEIFRAGYSFKVYEEGGAVPLKVIEGNAYVPKNTSFAVFAGPFDFGEAVPSRVVYEWNTQTLVWSKNSIEIPDILIDDKRLSGEDAEPRLSAEITNRSLENIKNLEFTAILTDEVGNTVGVSKTFIDILNKGDKMPIVFTWPGPFKNKATSVEILMRILPNKSFL